MKRQQYSFVSNWVIPASPNFVDHLLLTGKTTEWWRGLESMTLVDTRADSPSYRCVWRSRSGYRLATTLTITEHQPATLIAFRSSGDLEGAGSFRLAAEAADTTRIVISWNVTTTKWWMNLGAPLLRPIFIHNHQALMAAGERGLQEYVLRNR